MKNCQRPKLLIIDDDDEYHNDMAQLLSNEFDIETAAGSRQAMEAIARSVPDCILLDLNMPCHYGDDCRTEGYSFLSALRSLPPSPGSASVPIFVVSSRPPDDDRGEGGREDVVARFAKPVDLEELTNEIKARLER